MYVLTAGHIVAVFDRNRAETSALSAGPITLTSLPNNDAVRVSVDCMDDRSICPQGRSRWPACPAPLRLRRSPCVRRVHGRPFHPSAGPIKLTSMPSSASTTTQSVCLPCGPSVHKSDHVEELPQRRFDYDAVSVSVECIDVRSIRRSDHVDPQSVPVHRSSCPNIYIFCYHD